MMKVLCIDDTPDDIIVEVNKTLRNVLHDTFAKKEFYLEFRENQADALSYVKENPDVGLVLLDVNFNGLPVGVTIAKELAKHYGHIKIIVLSTEKQTKRTFKRMDNVAKFIEKKHLADKRLKNLAIAVITDFDNCHWQAEYSSPALHLTNTIKNKMYRIQIPTSFDSAIQKALKNPNTPVSNPKGAGDGPLEKLIFIINSLVFDKTEWSTWGILSQQCCLTGEFKMIIGPETREDYSLNSKVEKYISQIEFEEYKYNIEQRISTLEKLLKLK